MLISICIPCYKSAKTLPTVVAGIQKVFAERPEDYQIVLANDGSPDNTFEVITALCKEDKNITGINLARNFGQAAAKMAALQEARGEIVVFMDDDGQHPSEGIPKLVDKIYEGYDVVYAAFTNKQHTAAQKVTSDMHNKLSEAMGTKVKGVSRSSFVAWSSVVVNAMKEYDSPYIAIGSYVPTITNKFTDVEIEHQKRLEGKSGYNFKKRMKLFLNNFFSFSMLPLRISTYLGFIFSIVGFIWIIVLLILKIANPSRVAGYTSTMVAILFVGGIILIVLGIMGEYVGRIYMTISGLKQYNIRCVINGKESD